jgi:hypothetical protein
MSSIQPKRPSKRSIVGSMGLPRYEKPEEPEPQAPLNAGGEDAEEYDEEEEETTTSPQNGSTTRRALRTRSAVVEEEEEESGAGGGMLGKFKSMRKKKTEAPIKPADTRRRKYNDTFGKKSGIPQEEGNGAYDDDSLSPQQDRQRTASAIHQGNGSSAGTTASTAEEVKSAAKAREANGKGGQDLPSDDEDYTQAEPADVADTDSAPAIIASSSLAPALTGGYLDENVPSYDLTDPSKKDRQASSGHEKEKSNGYAGTGMVAAVLGAVGLGGGAAAAATTQDDDGDIDREDEEKREAVPEKRSRPKKSPLRPQSAMGAAAAGGVVAEETEEEPKNVPMTRRKANQRANAKVASLTVYQRHYLLKALVSIQMQQEFSDLEKLGALTQYGFPFSLERPKLKRIKDTKRLDGDFGGDCIAFPVWMMLLSSIGKREFNPFLMKWLLVTFPIRLRDQKQLVDTFIPWQ